MTDPKDQPETTAEHGGTGTGPAHQPTGDTRAPTGSVPLHGGTGTVPADRPLAEPRFRKPRQ